MTTFTQRRAEHFARVAERNEKMTLYLGTVSCDLHSMASRVRVSIPGTDEIPISVKAVIGNYPRHLFKRNVTVEVERSKADGRLFRVTRVFEAMKKPIVVKPSVVTFDIRVKSAEEFGARVYKDDKTVRFWLGRRYFDDCVLGNRMRDVLRKTLNMNNLEVNRATTERGCWVICRESQFARFLIERNVRGLPNLFQELRVEYHKEAAPRPEINVSDR